MAKTMTTGIGFSHFCALCRPTGVRQAHLSLCNQIFSCHHHVAEPCQHVKSLGVLGQTSIANFVITKNPLDVEKTVLNFCPHTGFQPLQFCRRITLWKLRSFTRTHSDLPVHLSTVMFWSLPNSKVAGIAPHSLLFAVQKLIGDHDVMDIRRRRGNAVNKTKGIIGTNVHLHSKVPRVAFFGLIHFWITLATAVFRRRRCTQNGGINEATFAQNQAFSGQMSVDCLENNLAKLVFLQKVPEVQNGGLVWQIAAMSQPGKLAHGLNLVQSIFHSRITKIVEKLHRMNTQHDRQRIRWSSGFCSVILLGQLLFQLFPRDKLVHFLQKYFPTRFLFLGSKFSFGKGQLGHDWLLWGGGSIMPKIMTFSEVP